jgi:hypothetical protein
MNGNQKFTAPLTREPDRDVALPVVDIESRMGIKAIGSSGKVLNEPEPEWKVVAHKDRRSKELLRLMVQL